MLFALTCLLLLGIEAATAADKPDIAHGDAVPNQGLRVYHIGNSHTDTVRSEVVGLAGAAGDHAYAYDTRTIPGAPLRFIAEHPGELYEDLRGSPWDVIIMQSYNSTNEAEIQAAISFTEAAREANPEVRVIMYSIWPNDENWDAPELGRREEWNETVMARLREEFPDLQVEVAPTSLIIRRVGNLADAGLIPGMDSRRSLYKDPGHMGPNGAYAIASCKVAMLYGVPPLDLPHVLLRAHGRGVDDDLEIDIEMPAATARAMRLVVMDVLAEYQHTEVDTGLWITTGRLDPAIVGRAYEAALPIAHAAGPVTWSIVAGELPAGLSLADGVISGTPSEPATARLQIRAASGAKQVEREVVLVVDRDEPPTIAEQTLPEVSQDTYIAYDFQGAGGIGRLTWRVSDGRMPYGLKLLETGSLIGTPGEAGEFTFTIAASDKHPDGAQSAEREFSMQVAPAGEDVLRVRRVDARLERKQTLSDQGGSPVPLPHVLRDETGNEVGRFGLAWSWPDEEEKPDWDRDRRGRGGQLMVIVEVAPDAASSIPNEAVHVYYDMAHNRETIYNEDDVHFMLTSDHDSSRAETVQGYKSTRYVDPEPTENGGWRIAFYHQGKMFAGYGIHTWFGPGVSYGFDLAIGSEDDPKQRVYFFGSPESDSDTRAFGSILIVDEAAD